MTDVLFIRTCVIYFRANEDVEDEVDSDFSIDENDEVISNHEDDGVKRKKGRLVTKAYKVNITALQHLVIERVN